MWRGGKSEEKKLKQKGTEGGRRKKGLGENKVIRIAFRLQIFYLHLPAAQIGQWIQAKLAFSTIKDPG